jgi:hypothetical protein
MMLNSIGFFIQPIYTCFTDKIYKRHALITQELT